MDGYFARVRRTRVSEDKSVSKRFTFSTVSGDVTCMIGTLSKADGNGKDDVRKHWPDWLNKEK